MVMVMVMTALGYIWKKKPLRNGAKFLEIPGRASRRVSPWHPLPQAVGTDLGLCGIWMLLICPYVITMTHGTVWVTQTRAWGTCAGPVGRPTCLDPCLNRYSMTQRQGRVLLHDWLVSSAPGSSGFAARQLRGRPCHPHQQCPSEGATHRKGQPPGQPASPTQGSSVEREHRAQCLFRSLVSSAFPRGFMCGQKGLADNHTLMFFECLPLPGQYFAGHFISVNRVNPHNNTVAYYHCPHLTRPSRKKWFAQVHTAGEEADLECEFSLQSFLS